MSQKDRVIDYIERHGSITPMEALRDLGVYRLSDAIYKLRREGVEIETETETSSNRWGETTSYARYRLNRPAQMELF